MARVLLASLVAVLPLTAGDGRTQSLEFYISKAAIDCVVAHEAEYIAAKTYDFAIVFPATCPEIPSNVTVGNEYLNLPEDKGGPPAEPEAIIVPVNRFSCLRDLAAQTTSASGTDLLLVDLNNCTVRH